MYLGCRWHGHVFEDPWCPQYIDGENERETADRRQYTANKIGYLRSRGYTVVEMMGCEWERLKRNDPAIRAYLYERFYPKRYAGSPFRDRPTS